MEAAGGTGAPGSLTVLTWYGGSVVRMVSSVARWKHAGDKDNPTGYTRATAHRTLYSGCSTVLHWTVPQSSTSGRTMRGVARGRDAEGAQGYS